MKLVSKKKAFVVVILFGCPSLIATWVSESFIKPPWYFQTARKESDGLNFDFSGVNWMNIKSDPFIEFGLYFEDVLIPGMHNSTLRGWFIPGPPPLPWSKYGTSIGIVAVHGAGGDRRELMRLLPMFYNAGYSSLFFDCREHGVSYGNFRGISFGLREHNDVIQAVKFLKKEKEIKKVAVIGTSQGGASVVMAAAKESGIDAVISENPFSSLDELLKDAIDGILSRKPRWAEEETATFTSYIVQMGQLVPQWFRLLVRKIVVARILWFNSEGEYINTEDAITRLHQPLLLIHGTADSLIPIHHSRKLFQKAHQPKQFWIAEGSEHAAVYNMYPREYEEKVISFLQQYM